jgi:hypothetical protein
MALVPLFDLKFLTEIAVNLELFDASRPAAGTFTKKRLEDSREDLLSSIAKWFHEFLPGRAPERTIIGDGLSRKG